VTSQLRPPRPQRCKQALAGLPLLAHLELEGNPVAAVPGYAQRAPKDLGALQTWVRSEESPGCLYIFKA